MIGWTFRVFTAGVVGANTGAGLLMVSGVPLWIVVWMLALSGRAARDAPVPWPAIAEADRD